MPDIGTLDPVAIRELWAGEAKDFTPWLAERADLMGKALGLDLVHEETEVTVGRYSADILFRDVDTKRPVVVENMFGSTDHDHLGKLITYAAGLDAAYAVLLATEFREEHRAALDWLNRVSAEGFAFFGVVLEAWRIGDSLPAPRLHVEVKPDGWLRSFRATRSEPTAYRRFWTEFLPAFRAAHRDWSNRRNPSTGQWMGFASGCSWCGYHAAFCKADGRYRLRAEVYIDTGNKETTKEAFDKLHAQKQPIEQSVGEALEWDRLDNRQGSRISLYFDGDMRITQEDRWPDAQAWLVSAMGKMRAAFGPAIQEI